MIDLNKLASSHERLRQAGGRWSVPKLTMTKVEARPAITEAHVIEAAIRAACGSQGWLRFESAICRTDTMTASRLVAGELPLAGEWFDGSGSWRLSPAGSPGLSALRGYFEEGCGESYLRQDVHVLARSLEPTQQMEQWMAYATYWEIDRDGRARCAFDRFLGFREEREAELDWT